MCIMIMGMAVEEVVFVLADAQIMVNNSAMVLMTKVFLQTKIVIVL